MNRISSICTPALVGLCLAAASATNFGADQPSSGLKGKYVEACSCQPPCGCEISGIEKGCAGLAALEISNGSYDGVDLSGVKLAMAAEPGDWLRVYVDARRREQAKAAQDFARAYFGELGKIEAVQNAEIGIEGDGGEYTVQVDGGKIMRFQTKPILGADGKSPVQLTNVKNPVNSTLNQGRVVSGKFKDGNRSIELDGSNAFFCDLRPKREA